MLSLAVHHSDTTERCGTPLRPVVYLGRFTTINVNSVREARAMGETQLGRMQFRIMQVLWDRKRANAREITEALNDT
jgi:hypothetical protein